MRNSDILRRKKETDMQDNKGNTDIKDNAGNTDKPAEKADYRTELAKFLNSDSTVKSDSKVKTYPYSIKPAPNGQSALIGATLPEGAFVAARTHVGTSVDPAVRIFIWADSPKSVKPGELVETNHKANRMPCGIWTVLDKTDARYVPGAKTRINFIWDNKAITA